ncbi:MAG: outer membrane protein assembly factor BamE [Lachnospiraceae bacterium]|nr:outer membrane protein assembly factor BamE [Lachnospiraceae bacterium]
MKRSILLIQILLILVFCVTACGKHADNSTVNEANISNDETADKMENFSADGHSYDVNEILSDLTIDGVSIDWPCELEDVQKVFELGDPYSFEDFPDILWYDLYSDNNKVGEVLVSENNSIVVLLGLSYLLNDGVSFEFKGVTENSSYSDVIRLLGEPTYQSEVGYRYIDYYDVNQDRTEAYTYDEIGVSFNDDNIRRIEFYCSRENASTVKD